MRKTGDIVKDSDGLSYTVTVESTTLRDKPITITHLTPILTKEEREKRKREIESRLYDIFVKYTDN